MLVPITVTQEHIDRGRPRDGDGCPWHLVLSEITGRHIHVSSGLWWILGRASDDTEGDIIGRPLRIPPEVQVWIGSYDTFRSVSPMTAMFDIPDEYLPAIPVENWPIRVPDFVQSVVEEANHG